MKQTEPTNSTNAPTTNTQTTESVGKKAPARKRARRRHLTGW